MMSVDMLVPRITPISRVFIIARKVSLSSNALSSNIEILTHILLLSLDPEENITGTERLE